MNYWHCRLRKERWWNNHFWTLYMNFFDVPFSPLSRPSLLENDIRNPELYKLNDCSILFNYSSRESVFWFLLDSPSVHPSISLCLEIENKTLLVRFSSLYKYIYIYQALVFYLSLLNHNTPTYNTLDVFNGSLSNSVLSGFQPGGSHLLKPRQPL